MYWKCAACIFAALSVLGSAAACESEPEQTSYVTTVEYVTPPSYESSEIRYEPEPRTVTRPVETESASPNPGGVGISASFFL